MSATLPPIVPETVFSLPIAEAADINKVGVEARRLGERCGLGEPLLGRFITSAEDAVRRALRLRGDTLAVTLRGTPGEASLLWHSRNIRLPSEASRPHPALTTTAVSKTLSPGTLTVANRDLRVHAAGWRWPIELTGQAVVFERPHPRETQSGDMTFIERGASKLRLAVIDGLGHGPAAREAAQRAVLALQGQLGLSLEDAILKAHQSVATTRGATLGLVDVDLEAKLVRATTIGNIRVVMFFGPGRLWSPCGTDAVLGHGRGTFHGRLDIRVEQHPLPPDALLALFSDGLQSQLRLPWQRPPELEELALQLFSTYAVATDDATLLLVS